MNKSIESGKNKLEATIVEPSEKNLNRLAVFLVGFCDSKDKPHSQQFATDLARVGYTTATFNPTGTWESEGKIKDYTITQYLEDTHNVINHLTVANGKNFDQVAVFGHSLGGIVALFYASSEKTAAVGGLMSPRIAFSSSPELVKDWQEKGTKIARRDDPDPTKRARIFRIPFSMFEDSQKYDTFDVLKNSKTPTLFVVGQNDILVSPKNVQTQFEQTNGPRQIKVLPNGEHHYGNNPGHVAWVNRRIAEFLSKYIDDK